MHSSKKLGFWGLTALVFGLMVGVGIFNLPQNMAATSSVGAVTLAWIITACGMLTLVAAFKYLSDKYPNLNAGIYQYAEAGFGEFAGFNTAWGYWLCSAFSNVAYAVMLNDTLGAFFPELLNHGLATVIVGSVFIWIMFFIVAQGIRTAKIINTILAAVKVLLIVFIIVVFCIHFDILRWDSDIWGATQNIGSVGHQIKGSMMVTLFCFFGVEGAVMLAARAKKSSDVGKAGVTGFLISLLLYMLISILCFGLMTRAKLAGLQDPSIAYILRVELGEWAYYFVIISLLIALLGGWVAWTLVVAQVPYEAATVKILPKIFTRTNRNNMPTFGLMASSIAMELFLLLVVMSDNVYLTALHITGLMILPCYLFTALFLWKKADSRKVKIIAAACTLFCCWMIYAGGIRQMLMTSVFYLCGVWFFIKARRENTDGCTPIFSRKDFITLGILSLASLFTVFDLMIEGSPF